MRFARGRKKGFTSMRFGFIGNRIRTNGGLTGRQGELEGREKELPEEIRPYAGGKENATVQSRRTKNKFITTNSEKVACSEKNR